MRQSGTWLSIILIGLLALAGLCLLRQHTRLALPWRAQPATTTPEEMPAPRSQPTLAELIAAIETERMRGHITHLAGTIGVRRAGSPQEREAARYLQQTLAAWGYQVEVTDVPLPNGKTSCNVIAEWPGAQPQAILIGAHMDSKYPAPGANDNASGVAVMLELARILRQQDVQLPCTVIFVAFGAEERIDGHHDHHHYGSRALAQSPAFRARLKAMTSLDMVGVGDTFYIDNWTAATTWRDRVALQAKARYSRVKTGQGKPWSDHEAFAKQQIPVAYLHWERDAAYHTRRDRPERISNACLRTTAATMLAALLAPEER